MSIILAGMINIGQFVGIVPTMLFIDSIGRRPLAIWGAIGMMIAHATMGGIYGAFGTDWPAHAAGGWACVAFVCMCSQHHQKTLTSVLTSTGRCLRGHIWPDVWSSNLDVAF
jgi:MFS family permease